MPGWWALFPPGRKVADTSLKHLSVLSHVRRPGALCEPGHSILLHGLFFLAELLNAVEWMEYQL